MSPWVAKLLISIAIRALRRLHDKYDAMGKDEKKALWDAWQQQIKDYEPEEPSMSGE